MLRRVRPFVHLLLGLLLLTPIGQLAAQAAPEPTQELRDAARAEFARGRDAFSAQRYDEAIQAFERANGILPNARLLLYIGQAYSAKQEYGQAVAFYRQYAASSEQAATEVADTLRELEAATLVESFAATVRLVEDAIIKATGATPPPRSAQRYALGANVRDVAVQITSTPRGATVYIDDVDLGPVGITPLDTRLFVGPHLITVEMQNLQPVSRVIQVTVPRAGESIPHIDFTLEKMTVPVDLSADPGSAMIWYIGADGSRQRLGLGRYQGELPAGPCTFILQQGGRDRRIQFAVAPTADGAPTEIKLSLNETASNRAAPVRVGTLRIISEGLDGELFVNDRKVGAAPGEVEIDLTPGNHKVELRRRGHQTWTQSVRISPDAETVIYPRDMPED